MLGLSPLTQVVPPAGPPARLLRSQHRLRRAAVVDEDEVVAQTLPTSHKDRA